MKRILVLLTVVLCAAVAATAAEPLVHEGKAWSVHYFSSLINWKYNSKKWLPEIYFEGKCDRMGKEYTVLRTSPVDTISLMRQDGGKVYVLLDEKFLNRWNSIYDEETNSKVNIEDVVNTEALVYDFDAKTDDILNVVSDNDIGNVLVLNMRIRVNGNEEVEINGETMRRQWLWGYGINIAALESYGADFGRYLIPQRTSCFPLARPDAEGTCASMASLHHVVDTETREEILVKSDFYVRQGAVEEIPAELPSDGVQARPNDNKMYDLNGQEIHNPLPGTIYIQNGEKHVAK